MKVEFYPIKILGKPLLRFEVKKFQNNLKQCQLAKMIYNFWNNQMHVKYCFATFLKLIFCGFLEKNMENVGGRMVVRP